MLADLRVLSTLLTLVQRSRLRALRSRARAAFRLAAEVPAPPPSPPSVGRGLRAPTQKVKLSALVDAAADTDVDLLPLEQ
eukprot:5003388-Lingulodinium_polyedra.AAC.1